jgi:sugar phosphate isomerase/epimerase
MKAFQLSLTDLHGSDGEEKRWYSLREHERLAGVELVKNRIEMTARLGSDVVIMHMGSPPEAPRERTKYWSQLWKSLDKLQSGAKKLGVRIAIENGRFADIREVLNRYPQDYVGLCYDCGHGNVSRDGLDETEALKDRLIAVHLHDNDGSGDQHKIPFMGTVDWDRLAGILARSAYKKWISMEVSMRQCGIADEPEFLRKTFEAGTRLTQMVASKR